MKKLTAIFLSLIMLSAICVSSAILAYAEDENLALNKPLVGIEPLTGDNETRKGNLTDGKYPDAAKCWNVGSGEDGAENYMLIVKEKNASAEGVAEGVIDLGKNCEVSEVKVYIGTGIETYKIYAPEVTVSLSTDGTNYTEFGKYTCADTSKDFWDFVTISGTKKTARYAKVTFKLNGSFALVADIQIMGTAATSEGDTSSTDSSSAESTGSTSSEATSSEAASSADTSSTPPTTPSTGDASIIVLVVMALVAVMGASVMVKARR